MSFTAEKSFSPVIVTAEGGPFSSRLAQRVWTRVKNVFFKIDNQKEHVDSPRPIQLTLAMAALVAALGVIALRQENATPSHVTEAVQTHPTQESIYARPIDTTEISREDLADAPGFTGINHELKPGELGAFPEEEISKNGSLRMMQTEIAPAFTLLETQVPEPLIEAVPTPNLTIFSSETH